MNRIVVLIGFLIAFGVSAQVTIKDPEAKKVLDAASEKFRAYKSFKAKFQFELESKATGMNESYIGEVTVKGEKFLIKSGDGKSTYNNGKNVWNYYADDNEVTIFTYDPEDDNMSINKMLNMYKSGYKYQLLADEVENGKTLTVIDLEPDLSPEERKTNQVFKIRMKFDKKTNMVVSWKIFERNGNRYTMSISSFTPNVEVSDSVFEFDKTKHPGVVVEDLR